MRKYEKGEPIESIEELLRQDAAIFNDKVYVRGWFNGWQIGWTSAKIRQREIYRAVAREGKA